MKIAIYSAAVGNYDIINQPTILDCRFDFFLFSNDPRMEDGGVWKIRKIPYHNADPIKIARWVKTHPEDLLPGYDASVWIDANVGITDDFLYSRTIQLLKEGTPISSMWHHERDCIYDEAAFVGFVGLEKEDILLRWLRFLLSEKYPRHNGLHETNVVFRRHDDAIALFNRFWWNYIEENSLRDQLSFDFLLWKQKLDNHYFINHSENVRNSYHFIYNPHAKKRPHPKYGPNDIAFWFHGLPGVSPTRLGSIYILLAKSGDFKWMKKLIIWYLHGRCFLASKIIPQKR